MSKSEECRACGTEAPHKFTGELIGRQVDYFECPRCGYLQTEQPTWLAEAYASPINITDTGLMERNVLNTRRVGALCLLLGKTRARIADFAGGYGILVRMLRDAGFDARWSDKFCDNLFARGFEHAGERTDIAAAFEAFEHFVEPDVELSKMLAVAPIVVLSTLLLPEPVPPPGSWWYYGPEHGQHVGLFRRKTLELMAQKHGGRLFSNDSDFHVIMTTPATIDSNRLGWMMRLFPVAKRFWLRPLTGDDHAMLVARQMSERGSKTT